jgi:hypothetical protein
LLRNFSLYKISNIDTNDTSLDAINASLNDFSLGTSSYSEKPFGQIEMGWF